MSRTYCNLVGREDSSRRSSAYNRAASLCIALPNPYIPASYAATLVSQSQMTTSTTILNIVGDSRLPCVTPMDPLDRAP